MLERGRGRVVEQPCVFVRQKVECVFDAHIERVSAVVHPCDQTNRGDRKCRASRSPALIAEAKRPAQHPNAISINGVRCNLCLLFVQETRWCPVESAFDSARKVSLSLMAIRNVALT